MAHYNVNAGVPKTLIQHLIRWVISSQQFDDEVCRTLNLILAAEISPELVPVKEGETATKHRGDDRPIRTPGFQSLLYAAIWIPTLKDSFLSSSRLGIDVDRRLAGRFRYIRPAFL